MTSPANRRILLVDDMPTIHEDFRKILAPPTAAQSALKAASAALFGDEDDDQPTVADAASPFEIDSAYQGQEGLAKVEAALARGLPYAMAFVDMRMPPGWDGVETIERLWQIDPRLQVVICTAYSDSSWEEKKMVTTHNVDIDEALKTRQFYQLWIALCMNVSAGIGVLAVASTMMTEIFGTTLPGIVNSAFAGTYVVMISIFNMLGRFLWASSS